MLCKLLNPLLNPLSKAVTPVTAMFVAILMTLTSVTSSIAYAQSGVPDTEPPVIELEEIPEGTLGQDQVFTALVTDNGKLLDVKLYFRFSGSQSYNSIEMNGLANTRYYTASVATKAGDNRSLEYYIQARDEGGNRVVKGFAFDPLVRELVEARAAPVAQPQVATPSENGGLKVWHVVLGVLAVGALAGLAAAGGGGDGGTNSNQTVPLTVTVTPPNTN